jgi:hypothetical protein
VPRKKSKSTSARSAKSVLSEIRTKHLPLSSFIIAAVLIGGLILIGFLKNNLVVATVNGEPVNRIELLLELEKRQGKEALNNLVTERLVLQEAKKRNLTVTTEEIDNQIADIEKNLESQGQKLDALLAAQNLTRADLKEQIEIQVLLKKLVGAINVTDKEIADFIEANREALPESTDQAQLESQVKMQLEQQKTGEKIQALVAELQQKAKIDYLLPL